MNISELTDMLVTSSQQYNQAKFNPWWEGDHKEAIYRYSVFSEKVLEEARDCVAGCGKDEIFSPVGEVGLTLFHLLVWHNFQDVVKDLLEVGKAGQEEIDMPDGKGHGLTPLLLACACGNEAMVRLLLEHGADGSVCDERGMNGYHFLAYPRIPGLEMAHACREKSTEQRREIARLLNCDINQKDQDGLTPFVRILAGEYNSEYTWSLVEVFLEKGAATDYVDEEGNTLLMMALRNRHRTAAVSLMERCPEMINTANAKGDTPIGHVISFRNQAMYIALKDHGAVPAKDSPMELFPLSQITSNAFADVHGDDKDGQSLALYLAKKLIRQADPDDDDEVGEVTNILHNALMGDGEASILDVIKETGYDFTMPVHYHGRLICLRDECLHPGFGIGALRKLAKLGVDLDRAIVRGRTPANLIASESIRGLLDESYFGEAAKLFSGDSMEQLDSQGEAAVHLAAREGHVGMLRVMIEKGVDMNLAKDTPARAGMTPLHEACETGNREVVKLLMEAGADDGAKDVEGETPAHYVLREKRNSDRWDMEKKAAVLKELKNLDIPRNDGKTPLLMLRHIHRELLPVFLERGVDINHRDNAGRTAMMLNPDKDMVKELIRAGADVNLADNEGNTALHHALQEYSEGTARYLIKKGADYNRTNNDGKTAADIAVERGFESVLELMV